MSAVTASIIVGTRHRSDPGVQPRWLVLLHEGKNHAWHLVRLQLTSADIGTGPDAPPGVLWRSSSRDDLVDQLALLLHLYAARTPEVVELAKRCPTLGRRRADLDTLTDAELGDYRNAMRRAAESGRELMLATTLHRESRLTEDALVAMPDWELDIAHTALTRHWNSLDGSVLTDFRLLDLEPPDASEDDIVSWIEGGDEAKPVPEPGAPADDGHAIVGTIVTSSLPPVDDSARGGSNRVPRRRWGRLGEAGDDTPADSRHTTTPRAATVGITDLFARE